MVAVVLVTTAVVLYVLTLGFGSDGPPHPYVPGSIRGTSNGVEVTFGYPNTDIYWHHVKVNLTDGAHHVEWTDISSEDLDGGAQVSHTYEMKTFAGGNVLLKIYDDEGDGLLDDGDVVTIESVGWDFLEDEVYAVTLYFIPTNGWLVSGWFTGEFEQ